MSELMSIPVGVAVLVYCLLIEGLWYLLCSRCRSSIQRWCANIVQFVRLVALVLVLEFACGPGLDEVSGLLYIVLVLSFIIGIVRLTAGWSMENHSGAARVTSYAKYDYTLPYNVRWYLRRTSISNAIYATFIAMMSWKEDGILVEGFPLLVTAFPVLLYTTLTILRRRLGVFEAPIWTGAILHDTSAIPDAAKPGHPNPLDVEAYLHSMPPEPPQ